jgi:hypothetical protein
LIAEEQERGESDSRRGPYWSYTTAVDDWKNFGEFTCRKLRGKHDCNLGEVLPDATWHHSHLRSRLGHVISSREQHDASLENDVAT